jgi:hypothetical protein
MTHKITLISLICCTLFSCTVQKRIHQKGFHVKHRKVQTEQSFQMVKLNDSFQSELGRDENSDQLSDLKISDEFEGEIVLSASQDEIKNVSSSEFEVNKQKDGGVEYVHNYKDVIDLSIDKENNNEVTSVCLDEKDVSNQSRKSLFFWYSFSSLICLFLFALAAILSVLVSSYFIPFLIFFPIIGMGFAFASVILALPKDWGIGAACLFLNFMTLVLGIILVILFELLY